MPNLPDDKHIPIDPENLPSMPQLNPGIAGDYALVNETIPEGYSLKVCDEKVRVLKPIPITMLKHKGTVWMSDTPQEIYMMKHNADQACGNVLISGLGLGVFPRLATKAANITIAEIQKEVIDLIWHQIEQPHMQVIHGDIVEVMKDYERRGAKFHYIYHDIWDKGDYEYLPWINWLIKQSQSILAPGGEATAWNYENMVDNYARECLALWKHLRNDVSVLTPEKREGMKRMWPLMAEWIFWAVDHKDAKQSEKRAKAIEIGRTLIKEPDQLMENAFPGGSGE